MIVTKDQKKDVSSEFIAEQIKIASIDFAKYVIDNNIKLKLGLPDVYNNYIYEKNNK